MTQNSHTKQLEALRALHAQGQFERAATMGRQMLARRPNDVDAMLVTAASLLAQEDAETAARLLRRALRVHPRHPDLLRFFGVALSKQHRWAEARDPLQQAFAAQPAAETARNLALVLQQLGDVPGAIEAWDRVLALEPTEAHFLDAIAFAQNLGFFAASERWCRAAAEGGLGTAKIWEAWTWAVFCQRRFSAAIALCHEGLQQHPDNAQLSMTLSDALLEVGETREARAFAERAIPHFAPAEQPSLRLRTALGLPIVADTAQEIEEARAHLHDEVRSMLDKVRQEGMRIATPMNAVGHMPFMLAYHGQDNFALRRDLAALLREGCPDLAYTAPHCLRPRTPGPIRVGFLSAFWGNSSITKTSLGFMLNLDRERFRVVTIALGESTGVLGDLLQRESDEFVLLPILLDEARRRLAELELDVLFYQEPNAHPLQYLLSFSRLARAQCTSVGYPETTAVDTMDDFLTTPSFDPPGFEAHYTERLVRIEGTASLSYYFDPMTPFTLPRSAYGLPEGPLYACPQAPFKFHPDIDELFAEVLRRDPEGHLVLVQASVPELTEKIRARMQRTLGPLADRVIFLRHLREEEFNNMLQLVDVLLDPPYYSGNNTTIQALTLGTPVVTCEGRFHRERHTLSMLRAIDLDVCVAPNLDVYVARCIELAHDTPLRHEVRATLARNGRRLLGEEQAVLGFEAYLEDAVVRAEQRLPR